VNLYKSSNN